MEEKTPVYLNGKLMGFHNTPSELVLKIKEKRRKGEIDPETSISFNKVTNEVHITTDSGRVRKPYIVVENGKPKLTKEMRDKLKKGEIKWKELVSEGVIEFLDAEEEDDYAYVAINEDELTPQHTHLEIEPLSIFGITAGQLPYAEYNSSPRITMACAMGKQSLGIYASNFNLRMDSRAHVMFYPQTPLVSTTPYESLKLNKRPAGQNFIVAITSFEGYNMGDGIVMNLGSIQRALGRSVFYKTYETEERRYPGGQKDKFEIPDPSVVGYREEEFYRNLGEDGIISPECVVKPRDVLVGKTSPPRFLEEVSGFGIAEEKKKENSLVMKGATDGIVDDVMVTQTNTGHKMVKVRVRHMMIPEYGDKFASRHGQKGVVGLMAPQEDLPFTKEGIIPDLILNPHAIPSRMTAGHLLETLGGKAGSIAGKIMNGSAFEDNQGSAEDYAKILKSFGFAENGTEEMYDGMSGEKIKTRIFLGCVYYQKLHHLVANKMHVRSRGPVQLLTHQPTEGRAREGGLRFGEMERDCLIGYGASMLIKERLLEESDKTEVLVCSKCGSLAVHDHVKNFDYCPVCKSSEIYPVEMSYAFKLLLDEIRALGIFPRLVLKDRA